MDGSSPKQKRRPQQTGTTPRAPSAAQEGKDAHVAARLQWIVPFSAKVGKSLAADHSKGCNRTFRVALPSQNVLDLTSKTFWVIIGE
jgi:hypothetical protein